eukprot:684614-Amphidinium_carterae.1
MPKWPATFTSAITGLPGRQDNCASCAATLRIKPRSDMADLDIKNGIVAETSEKPNTMDGCTPAC